ncbi:MAG TPA: cellulase family glycosylhydrolase [Polyangia bacterium]|nr:cellulase family glycosylhydrolase [Polyangia bacterium]
MKLASLLPFVVVLVATLSGCSSSQPHYAPLDIDHGQLIGPDGRVVILRGINARVAGLFDVTFDDGRAPLETIPDLSDDDVARMASMGFNLLRLPLSWSGFEPEPGMWVPPFLDKVQAVVTSCREHGIYVLLDVHQDAWSKEIGEDGAPLWAISPPPPMLLGGPLTDLGDRRLSSQVMNAFSGFFTDDADMLQEKFTYMVQQLLVRFRGDPAVVGIEIFNEPLATDDELLAFHTKVAGAIRDSDPQRLFAFEPPATRNIIDSASLASQPFPVGGGVYAPHIYTAVFNNDVRLTNDTYEAPLAASVQNARDEADAWGTPLLIGELGVGPQQPNALAWIGHAYDAADAVFASAAFWVWKEQDQGQWGLFAHAVDGTWHDRPDMIAAVARPYAKAIGGKPTVMSWDGTTFTLAFEPRAGIAHRHDIFFPSPTPLIACDGETLAGADVTVDPPTSTFSIRCDGVVTLTRQ